MLLNPKTPLIFGTLAILGMTVYLTLENPAPGQYSRAHAQIAGISVLSACEKCHHSSGLAQGCLGCHKEIAAQLAEKKGYHQYLASKKELACGHCHLEHIGAAYPLTGELAWEGRDPGKFAHPQADYRLDGRHREASCDDCHLKKIARPFTLPDFAALARPHSYLGLSQDCVSCHEDPHGGGLSLLCEEWSRPGKVQARGFFRP